MNHLKGESFVHFHLGQNMNGIASSFISNQEKELMKSRFKKEWQELRG